MVEGKPADYKPIIEANKKGSLAYLISTGNGCIKDWEKFAVKGREFSKPIGALPAVAPPPKCVIGIVVCPGDDLRQVMDWVAKHKILPPERIMIIYHPDCDMVEILAPWYAHFGTDPLALELTKWPSEGVGRFGDLYNDWIYLDATGKSWPL